ncbi:MAG: biotin--[acetyl-CoA-carboxylase] ligase [Thiomicrorhabdus sp.]|nr:biotin--[acetyl-CoA-carboxylase] ligase [Thiomicrorhabdus sp.]
MNTSYSVIHLTSTDSTNRYLKDYVTHEQPSQTVFCVTQKQTAGYGQQNRAWQTNEHSAILSIAYPLLTKTQLPGLVSLHIAKVLHQSLTELTDNKLYLKWPNDLYNQHGKVAGILIEQVIKKTYRSLIIGIGINRNHTGLIESASSVSDFKTEQLIDDLFQKIAIASTKENQAGLLNFSQTELLDYWKTHDLFTVEEPIQLITAENSDSKKEGIYLGINSLGQAQIQVNNQIQTLSSGQTSIRKL